MNHRFCDHLNGETPVYGEENQGPTEILKTISMFLNDDVEWRYTIFHCQKHRNLVESF